MDFELLTVTKIITIGFMIILIIAAIALALRYSFKGKKIKTPIGSVETENGETPPCVCSATEKIDAMYTMLTALVETNNLQSSNIVMLCKVQRPIIKTLRSHSYALKEAGANGSTEKALEHIDEAEDILNDATIKGAKTAMSIGA